MADGAWRGIVVFACALTLAGSDDVQARYLHAPITAVTAFYRFFCVAAPIAAFAVAYAFAGTAGARRREAGASRSLTPQCARRLRRGAAAVKPLPRGGFSWARRWRWA